ncbi:hypothetical protein LI90_167 [Carbonactinospora thermoautotrophica]|uniref:Lipoprotein n=1 Tax=Carbonactinospora thermoautotrophica TaxID=1469144 RepID=A0A132ML10_9ACTN|nr:hypothetical protein [Carbonactinospora thermoautotrophica]KWW98544.1 hypothetical protein LI90_167 [Carbonactinospora thermoautotrophica]
MRSWTTLPGLAALLALVAACGPGTRTVDADGPTTAFPRTVAAAESVRNVLWARVQPVGVARANLVVLVDSTEYEESRVAEQNRLVERAVWQVHGERFDKLLVVNRHAGAGRDRSCDPATSFCRVTWSLRSAAELRASYGGRERPAPSATGSPTATWEKPLEALPAVLDASITRSFQGSGDPWQVRLAVAGVRDLQRFAQQVRQALEPTLPADVRTVRVTVANVDTASADGAECSGDYISCAERAFELTRGAPPRLLDRPTPGRSVS